MRSHLIPTCTTGRFGCCFSTRTLYLQCYILMLYPVSCDWFFKSYALSFDLGLSFHIHISITLSFDLGLAISLSLTLWALNTIILSLTLWALNTIFLSLTLWALNTIFLSLTLWALIYFFFSCAMFTLLIKLYELFRGNLHWHYSLTKHSLLQ